MARQFHGTLVVVAIVIAGSGVVRGDVPVSERVYYDYINEAGQLTGGQVIMLSTAPPRPPAAYTSDNRIHLVIVGDGYTSDQLGTYATHANNVTSTFFTVEPFQTYEPLFVIDRIDVISPESGVDNDPTLGISRDTALDMGYFCGGIERLLCVNVSKAYQYANTAPIVNYVLAIANSTKYGGAGYPDSALATVAGGNGSSVAIALHEMGHAIGNLADEYDYGDQSTYTGPERPEPNVSILTSSGMLAANSKWASWLGVNNSQFNGLISTYEGAYYSQYGIYRPTSISIMRALGYPFNLPSIEALIIKFYNIVHPIDSATSNSTPLGSIGTVVVNPVDLVGAVLDVQWSVDSQTIPGATGTSITLESLNLGYGNHQLSVTVTDNTAWVRNETARNQYLSQILTWTVQVIPGDFNGDRDVDQADFSDIVACFSGSAIPRTAGCESKDFDGDNDVDLSDFGIFQRCYSGENNPADPNCAN